MDDVFARDEFRRSPAEETELSARPDLKTKRQTFTGRRSQGEGRALSIGVIFVTCGRAQVLAQVVGLLGAQTRRPDHVVVSAVEPSDVRGLPARRHQTIVFGPKGACRQRNTALRTLAPSTDLVVFFDDDFVPHPRWLEKIEACFRERPSVDCVTGYLLADGVKGRGLVVEEGVALINRYRGEFRGALWERYSPYGCNMAYRKSAIADLVFDERLVLYGWLEDRDFGAAVALRGGKQIKIGDAVGVHLGVKGGRLSGQRLGYSQVVNPIYLLRKQHMTRRQVADHLVRNLSMNVVRVFWPEPHIDRLGRVVGNLKALVDVARGLLEPERAAQLP